MGLEPNGSATRSARAIAILGPYLSGKTTLLEAILARTGAIPRQNPVASGNTVSDHSPEAREHAMSVEATFATTEFMGDSLTFVDCPGSIEFAFEAEPVLAACDAAIVVAEADESDRSLLNLSPEAAILLNVDHDHHATYATLDEVRDVFRAFVARLPAGGLLVVGPDQDARACAEGAPCAVRLVGDVPGAFCRVERAPEVPGFDLVIADGRRVAVPLPLAGRHMAENAACALALADWCGVPLEEAAARLAAFTGVGRRMEHRGTAAGVEVVDDYAHHPAEIRATLAAARERAPGRVVVVFQPHLPSRTRALGGELAEALGAADVAIVTEIYLAR